MNKIMIGTKAVRDVQSRAISLNKSGITYKKMSEGKGVTHSWLTKWVNTKDPNTTTDQLNALDKVLERYEV